MPLERLSAEALLGLVDEFITREGTDYSHVEHSLEQKRVAVQKQIERGEVAVVFDPETESCNLISVTRESMK